MRPGIIITGVVLALAMTATAFAANSQASATQRTRIGTLIQYGPSSFIGEQPGSLPINEVAVEQHPDYPQKYAARFHPTQVQINRATDQWARLTRAMGGRYLIFTARHVDGYALWPTGGYGTDIDVVGFVAAACKRYKLDLILYYAMSDYYHEPRLGWPAYRGFVRGQLLDLVHRYHPAGFWLDNIQATAPFLLPPFGGATRWDFTGLMAELQANSPRALRITNNMYGFGGGYLPGVTALVYERGIPVGDRPMPSEIVDSIGLRWSYFYDDKPRSLTRLRAMLNLARAFHANLSLGLGPRPDGTVPATFAKAMRQLRRSL